jgi:hypothetical protein
MTTRHWALTGIWGRSTWGAEKWWATGGNAGSVNVPVSSANPIGLFPGELQPPTGQHHHSHSSTDQRSATAVLPTRAFRHDCHHYRHSDRSQFPRGASRLGTAQRHRNLAEPEVTTISGRQTQMRATQILTIITSFSFQQGTGGTTTTTTTAAPLNKTFIPSA